MSINNILENSRVPMQPKEHRTLSLLPECCLHSKKFLNQHAFITPPLTALVKTRLATQVPLAHLSLTYTAELCFDFRTEMLLALLIVCAL